ncbi:MAG: ABC transporter permease [Deltaproteobacteria bacterium]|nr:ABC transporter permease [Deltaproteobacteria bacterium]MBW2305409.1 ABC transporter permease [Deltaproteobacteria bacterium]
MVSYIIKRLLTVTPILFGVTVVVFFLTTLIPGDVVDIMLDIEVEPEVAARLRQTIGLDQPFVVRYWNWLSKLVQGDFGFSIINGRPVLSQIIEKYPPTLELAVLATIIGILIGIPFGVLSAIRQFHLTDDFLRLSSLIGFSLPSFWIGTMFLLMVSLWFPGFPILEYVPFSKDPILNLKIMSLPAITLGIAMAALIMRMTRACVLEVVRQQFVVTARSKGLTEHVILFKHVLRNAMIPVLTLVGLRFGFLIGGLVIVEEVFAIPGLGRLVIYSISKRDFPLILGVVFFIALSFMLINLMVDVLYAVIDPRISYGKKER